MELSNVHDVRIGEVSIRRHYRGILRWYEDSPAPAARRALSQLAREWSEHGEVAGDWHLAGRPGDCPVPRVIAAAPKLGLWLGAHLQRRPPAPEWLPAMAASHARVLAP